MPRSKGEGFFPKNVAPAKGPIRLTELKAGELIVGARLANADAADSFVNDIFAVLGIEDSDLTTEE